LAISYKPKGHWFGDDEVEQMVGEHALSRVRQHILGCVGTFKEHAIQYQFDQAERQLALLRAVLCHFSNTDLRVSLSALEALLAVSKQEAVQEVREEMEQKIQQLMSQLETVMRQMGMNENKQQRIREMAQEARNNILEEIR
jgi:ElaB/YqjD/DUF883 family membrane-anchored ribosome-binding protein